MSDEEECLLRDVLAELRGLRADLPLIRHELQRVAREHESLRIRVDALEEASDPFPSEVPQ